MKNNEPEQKLMADAELDAALAQMADEAPPMPADFHDRWINAVRAEAKEAESEPAEAASAPKNTVSIARWTRILSVAAVFVFLIGGTLLYRSTKKTLNMPIAAEKRETAEAPAAEQPAAMTAGAVENPEDHADTIDAEASLMMALPESEEEEAADTGAACEAQSMKAAGAIQNSYAAVAGEAPAETAEWEAEEAAEADYAAEVSSYDAAMPAPTAMPAAAPAPAATFALTPTPTAAPAATSRPAAAPGPAEEPEPELTGFLPAAGAFFTDMGDFLLAALPYLLVLAVPAVAALIIRRKKGRKS